MTCGCTTTGGGAARRWEPGSRTAPTTRRPGPRRTGDAAGAEAEAQAGPGTDGGDHRAAPGAAENQARGRGAGLPAQGEDLPPAGAHRPPTVAPVPIDRTQKSVP